MTFPFICVWGRMMTEFSDFIRIFRPYLFPEKKSAADFVDAFFDANVEDISTHPAYNKSVATLRSYYSGANDITAIASLLLSCNRNTEFETLIDDLDDNPEKMLYEVLKIHYPEINEVTLPQDCSDIFWKIVSNAAHRKKNISGRSKLNSISISSLAENKDMELDSEIREIINGLEAIKSTKNLRPLSFNALTLHQKIEHPILLTSVQANVSQYYPFIQNQFQILEDAGRICFDDIAKQITDSFIRCNSQNKTQCEIFNNMTDWVLQKTNSRCRQAADILISFFIQNCEIFYEISK